MKHFFVINPHSFRSLNDLKQVLLDCEDCFSVDNRMDYKIYFSRYPRDAVAAVHRHLMGITRKEIVRVYAIGGDGILFDCLNGMVNFPNAELTSVPYGSSNDFVRAFGEDAKEQFRNIKNLVHGPAQEMDIIHCGQNYALMEVSIGWAAQAVIYANAAFRNDVAQWPRSLTAATYSFGGTLALLNEHEVLSQSYTAILDGKDVSASYCDILVSNSACDGGSYIPMPYAKPNDGILDVTFTDAMNAFDMLRMLNDRNNGRFEKHKSLNHKQCRSLELKSELPMRVQMDGEAFYAPELKMKIVPNGVKIFTPSGMKPIDYSYLAYKRRTKKGEAA